MDILWESWFWTLLLGTDLIHVSPCVAVALLDEKRLKKPMRDFTLLVGSSFFHGFRKCVVRASTSDELLQAVMAALETQGVHIPPESLPMQIVHRDGEFREFLPVLDLDMLHGKARVRLEQTPPEISVGQGVEAHEGSNSADVESLRRNLQDAEARAASAAALQDRCDELSNSLAAVRSLRCTSG